MAYQPTYLPESISAYMRQYVKTATDGNVHIIFAYATDRMQLSCRVCDQALTLSQPESAEKVDWAMQEFVKLHRHAPLTTGEGTPTQITWHTVPPKITPVTADFKRVKPTRDDWGITEGRKFR